MEFSIVPFVIESYEEALALWQQCEGVGLSQADSEQSVRAYLQRNPGTSFLATDGKKVVGAVLAGHDGRRGYIHHLAVHPKYRRQGIARRLVDRCLEGLKRSGISKCHLFVFNDNSQGIAFWKSLGWTQRTDVGLMSKTIKQAAPGDAV